MRTPLSALLLLAALAAGCRQDMHDAPRVDPLEGSTFFDDGRSARPLVEGTVARGRLREDDHLHRGLVGGEPAATFPFELTREDLQRGAERFGIFCTPCHDATGSGQGMIVQRGMKRPPSFHVERLREAQPGYLFDVITRGYGAMYDYSDRIPAEDRWRIVGWVRVLQRSQRGRLEDVPPAQRAALEGEQL
jgi:hypothetical protein